MAKPRSGSRPTRGGKSKAEPLSVPVWVDEFREIDGLEVLRVAYLAAEAIEPTEAGRLPVSDLDVPMIATGLVAALCQPAPDRPRFESAQELDDFFKHIEEKKRLSVETPDFWLPLVVFTRRGHQVERGNVYRIDPRLLAAGVRFRAGRMRKEDLVRECERVRKKAQFSPVETSAFAEWSQMQVDVAIERYRDFEADGAVLGYDEKRDEGRTFRAPKRRVR